MQTISMLRNNGDDVEMEAIEELMDLSPNTHHSHPNQDVEEHRCFPSQIHFDGALRYDPYRVKQLEVKRFSKNNEDHPLLENCVLYTCYSLQQVPPDVLQYLNEQFTPKNGEFKCGMWSHIATIRGKKYVLTLEEATNVQSFLNYIHNDNPLQIYEFEPIAQIDY